MVSMRRGDYRFAAVGVKGAEAGYSFWMRVRVLYFGVLKELVGRESRVMEVAEGLSVAALVEVHRAQGRLEKAAVWSSVAVAVNQGYARGGDVLRDGDEVALLPPVSGGMGMDAD